MMTDFRNRAQAVKWKRQGAEEEGEKKAAGKKPKKGE
jgi:hypothetical protein